MLKGTGWEGGGLLLLQPGKRSEKMPATTVKRSHILTRTPLHHPFPCISDLLESVFLLGGEGM